MEYFYSNECNVQMLIGLLKAHGIKKIIVSPGSTNIDFVASIQQDSDFEMYSCIDERSAAYMACGLAAESQEPVVITCTEATASRNYLPGITEAYHRKLPVLAITCLHEYAMVGHLEPQVIDRSVSPIDCFKLKVNLPTIKDEVDEWESLIKINKALLELKRHGGGPVHINLPWPKGHYNFSARELSPVRVIKRFTYGDELPEMQDGKIALFVGSHLSWTREQIEVIERFCESRDAVVFCDHSSGYKGRYGIYANLLACQKCDFDIFANIDLLIHIGEESGDNATMGRMKGVKEVWRVSPDGELRDTFRKLKNVFEMDETYFFRHYLKSNAVIKTDYYKECERYNKNIRSMIPEIPFSNIYVASKVAIALPDNAYLHLGASNTIRAWDMFEVPVSVLTSGNMGCRGIDGTVSSLIGASFANPQQLHYCVVGDLTFFYDMNCLGNRCIKNNIRILLINNAGGGIFKLSNAPGHRLLGDENTDQYIAAGGHYGNKSKQLVRHFAEDLGFEYMCATNKEEFELVYQRFLTTGLTENPMVFEVFTETENEREAFDIMTALMVDSKMYIKEHAKEQVKQLLGEKGTDFVKRLIKK